MNSKLVKFWTAAVVFSLVLLALSVVDSTATAPTRKIHSQTRTAAAVSSHEAAPLRANAAAVEDDEADDADADDDDESDEEDDFMDDAGDDDADEESDVKPLRVHGKQSQPAARAKAPATKIRPTRHHFSTLAAVFNPLQLNGSCMGSLYTSVQMTLGPVFTTTTSRGDRTTSSVEYRLTFTVPVKVTLSSLGVTQTTCMITTSIKKPAGRCTFTPSGLFSGKMTLDNATSASVVSETNAYSDLGQLTASSSRTKFAGPQKTVFNVPYYSGAVPSSTGSGTVKVVHALTPSISTTRSPPNEGSTLQLDSGVISYSVDCIA